MQVNSDIMNEEVGDYGKPEPEFDISAADVNVFKDGQNRRKKNMVSGVDDLTTRRRG